MANKNNTEAAKNNFVINEKDDLLEKVMMTKDGSFLNEIERKLFFYILQKMGSCNEFSGKNTVKTLSLSEFKAYSGEMQLDIWSLSKIAQGLIKNVVTLKKHDDNGNLLSTCFFHLVSFCNLIVPISPEYGEPTLEIGITGETFEKISFPVCAKEEYGITKQEKR